MVAFATPLVAASDAASSRDCLAAKIAIYKVPGHYCRCHDINRLNVS